MAQLTRTAGQTLSLSEVRAFFDGKFDPAVVGVDGSSLSHYLRDGGIVPATSQGGGVTFENFYTGTPHARFGRGFNGADGTTNSAEHTWGIYANDADLTGNPTGVTLNATPLTMGSSYILVFNIRNEDGRDISSSYLSFEVGDRLRFERNTGAQAGNGYVFELTNAPVNNNDDGQGDNPVVVSMGAEVVEILGSGLLDDELSTSPNRDTLTASRALAVGSNLYPTTGIAMDYIGNGQMNNNNFYSWPTGNSIIQGASGFTYLPGTGSGSGHAVQGAVRNDTGNDITLSNCRLSLRITINTFPSGATFDPLFWVRRQENNVYFPSIPYTQAQLGEEMTISPAFDGGDGIWQDNQTLNFRLFSNDTPETPFTYTINSLRINLEGTTDFAPSGTATGGGGDPINEDVPETSPLSLAQLRNVDDGRTP